jgi:hypothetical protein
MPIKAHLVTPFRSGTVLVTGYDHSSRRADGSEPWVVVIDYNTERQRRKVFKSQTHAEAWLKDSVDWTWLNPQRQTQLELNFPAYCWPGQPKREQNASGD